MIFVTLVTLQVLVFRPVVPSMLFLTEVPRSAISEGVRNGRWITLENAEIDNCAGLLFDLSDRCKLANNWPEGELETNTSPTMDTAGGIYANGMGVDLPIEQKEDDKTSIIFETDPLEQLVEVIGNPRLRVILKSKDPGAFMVACLCDVALDGSSTRIPMATHQL